MKQGKIVCVDVLPMQQLSSHHVSVKIITGDFTCAETMQAIQREVKPRSVDLVLSDMAPNSSGFQDLDHTRIIVREFVLLVHLQHTQQLCQMTLDFAMQYLRPKGTMLVKLFAG